MKGNGGTKMKNHDREDFNGMKKEDNRYGETFHKTETAKDHNKKDKYVKKYQNLRREDLLEDDESDYDYDDGYQPLQD